MLSISVVIPLYNKEGTVHRALMSVMNQSVRPFEIIVVDDCSIDTSVELIHGAYSSDDVNLICLDENAGVSNARNVGIDSASGDVIALLDADDQWEPDFLKVALEVMLKTNADFVGTGYFYSTVEGHDRIANLAIPAYDTVRVNDYFDFSVDHDIPFTASSVLISRQVFFECGVFNSKLNMGEDQVLWNKLIINEYNCQLINVPLSRYFLNGADSACNSKLNALSWDYLREMAKDAADFSSDSKERYFNQKLIKTFFRCVAYDCNEDAKKIINSTLLTNSFFRRFMLSVMFFPRVVKRNLFRLVCRHFSVRGID